MIQEINKIYLHNVKNGIPLPDKSVDMCVTSPPYYKLRDYDELEQMGQEPNPEEFIENMVDVFMDVHRVMKDDGTLWINIGDTYATGSGGGNMSTKSAIKLSGSKNLPGEGGRKPNASIVKKPLKHVNIKSKDLIGIPWMLAFALRAKGWYLRQEIIWNKPNPMPESVNDRCTKAHETIFLFSKKPNYYFDQKAILQKASLGTHARLSQDVQKQIGSSRANGGKKSNGNVKAVGRKSAPANNGMVKNNDSFNSAMSIMPELVNKRSVWTVSTKPFAGDHFAPYPQHLIVDCVKAGCREGGIVLDPFIGSGTTAIVARKLNRNYIGFDINAKYIKDAEKRIYKELGAFK